MLGPHYTVYQFRGCVTNGTTWKGLGGWFRLTLITFTLTLMEKGEEKRMREEEEMEKENIHAKGGGKRRKECKR